MALNTRRIAGHRAQRNGANFEAVFRSWCYKSSIAVTRVPDGCKQLGAKRIIRVKTPWDWILTLNGKTALIDTKTINSKSFPYSLIERHQIIEMEQHRRLGGLAGYVVYLKAVDKIVFIPSNSLFASMMSHTPGSYAFDDPDCVCLGSYKDVDVSKLFPLN